jgi:uncharacterized protein (TIGR00251 family)
MGEKCFEVDVRVTPKSSRKKVEWDDAGGLKVWVTAAPTDGEANEAVVEALAKQFRTPKSSIDIIRGGTSRNKRIRFLALTEEEAHAKLH